MRYNKHKKHKNINQKGSPDFDLNQLFPDINEWPKSWAGFDCDIPVGNAILKEFKAFLNKQQTRISKKTLKDYGNYLWVLGGEIIRDTNFKEIKFEDLRDDFLLDYVDLSGGPYWGDSTNESDHERYDSICRCFYKYLMKNRQ